MSHQPTFPAGPLPGMNIPPGMKCSICLEEIVNNHKKGISILQCGHFFHLVCVGIAFNAKGAMECPNCRDVENNEWMKFERNSQRNQSTVNEEDADDGENSSDDGEEDTQDVHDGVQLMNTHVMHHRIWTNLGYYSGNSQVLYQNHQTTHSFGGQFMAAERMFQLLPADNRTFGMPSYGYLTSDGRNTWPTFNSSQISSVNNMYHHNWLQFQNRNAGFVTGTSGVGTSLTQVEESNPPNNWSYPIINLPSIYNLSSSSTTIGQQALNQDGASSSAADPPQLGLNMSVGGGPLYGN